MTAERPPRLGRWLAVADAIGLVSTGCGLLPTAGPTAHIENQTNTPMAVFVNELPCGAAQLSIGRIHDNLPAIAFAGMPACP